MQLEGGPLKRKDVVNVVKCLEYIIHGKFASESCSPRSMIYLNSRYILMKLIVEIVVFC